MIGRKPQVRMMIGLYVLLGLFFYELNVSAFKVQASSTPLLYTPTLLGHWKMDEASGTTVNDSSPVANHLTFTGPIARQEGYLGDNSIVFSNQQTASKNALTQFANLNTSQAYTVSLWVKPQPTNMNRLTINVQNMVAICFRNSGRVHIDVPGSNASFEGAVVENRWNHVTLTFADKKLTLYVNGVERGSKTFASTFTFTTNGYFAVGGIFSYDNPVQIDDLRLYSSALAIADIKKLAAEFKKETVLPTVPTNVKIMGRNDRAANFKWDASTDNIGITGYQLYLNGKPSVFSKELQATITGLQADTAYTVEVRAKDIAGNLSASSSQVRLITDATFDRAKTAIGMNMSPACYYCREPIFIDLAKSARAWTNWTPQGQGVVFPKDAYGNVTSLPLNTSGQPVPAMTNMGLEQNGNFRKGKYIITYDGTGTLEFNVGGGSSVLVNQPNYMEINAQGDGITLTLKSVDPDNYLKNLRVIHADDVELAQTKTFRPGYIEQWKDFAVTRYMTMMNGYMTQIVNWSDRTTPQHFSQGDSGKDEYDGVAVEYLVQLANELGTDPWYTMPYQANDDYVTQFATYVRDNLNPKAKIYVEYSNETWNTTYISHDYAEAEGKKLGYTGSDDEIAAKYHAHRAKQIFQIWETVFGGDERLVKVIGGFIAGGAYYAENILTHENVYQVADAYAPSSYFAGSYGTSRAEWVKTATPAEIFADLQIEVDVWNTTIKQIVDKVSQYGLQTIAYEGGQHMAPTYWWNEALGQLFNYTNDDVLINKLAWIDRQPQMYDIYQRHFDGWKAAGARVNATFISAGAHNRYGNFGMFEYYNQKHTPHKFNSVNDWNKNHPIWWNEEPSLPEFPAPPTAVQATNVTTQSLMLKWSAPAASAGKTVKEYEVFRDGVSIGKTSALSFAISGLKPKQKVMLGVKTHYNEQPSSAQTRITVTVKPDTALPTTPTGLQTSDVQMHQFNLSWTASTDNMSVTGYEILLNGKKVADAKQTQATVTGLKPATSYKVTVRALDSSGNRSALSAVSTVTTALDTAAPSAPQALYTLNVTPRSIDLYWSPSTDNVAVVGYEVFNSQTLLATVTKGTRLLLTDLPVANYNTSYQLTVKAFDAAGNRSNASTNLSRQTPPDTLAPTVPRGLRVSKRGTDQVTLVWEPATDNLGVASYEIYRDGTLSGTSTTPTAVVGSLSPATTYAFTVLAVDVRGNKSAQSVAVSATTPTNGAPAAPGLEITGLVGSQSSKVTTIRYKLLNSARLTLRVLNANDDTIALTSVNNVQTAAGTGALNINTTTLAEGDYRFNLIASTSVEAAVSLFGRLTVDRTKPVISEITTSNPITHENYRKMTTIGFNLSEPAVVTVSVLGETGNVLASLAQNQWFRAGANQVQWNGLNSKLALLPEGLYTVRFQVTDLAGNVADPASTPLQIDTLAPEIIINKQSTQLLKVKDANLLTVQYTLSEDAKVEVRLFNPDNYQVFYLKQPSLNELPQKKGKYTFTWNGKNLENKYMENGRYELRFIATDSTGRKSLNTPVYVSTEVSF